MQISVRELLSLNNPNIIDIRSFEKYNDNHIPGARNIVSNDLVSNPSKYLDRNSTYYIYCQKGITSKSTANMLRMLGYNVIDVAGGYESYILNNF